MNRRAPRLTVGATLVAILALSTAVLAGCTGDSRSSGDAAQSAPVAEAPPVDSQAGGSAGALGGDTQGESSREQPAGSVLDQRAIITTISTTVSVGDVLAATGKVVAAANVAGGYIQAQYTSDTDGSRPSSTITARIPTKGVERFTAGLAELGRVESSERSSADVTAEVADIDARLANAKAGVARLRALMARAEKISDIVAIESALSERQAEAESLAAQQRALADQTSLATITVVLVPTPEDPPSGFMGGLQAGWESFTATLSGMSRVVGFLLPFALLLGLAIMIAVLIVRRTGGHGRPRVAPAPGESAQSAAQPGSASAGQGNPIPASAAATANQPAPGGPTGHEPGSSQPGTS